MKRVLWFFAVLTVMLVYVHNSTNCFSDEFDLQLKKVYPKIVTPYYGTNDNNCVIFEFSDPQYENVRVKIYTIDGRNIREIDSYERTPKANSFDWCFKWNCLDSAGSRVNPGVYLYVMEAKNKVYNGTIIVAQ
ncbi:MAG: hypothetical protein A2252_10995 [Elusimicrobia bacterium RIFOXYA2_FULL_39_19]|nr:MAG: hypothetical protein A2252_10995 [Elusimicrobia bacterium RIFOXYA2_FULL_39_19]